MKLLRSSTPIWVPAGRADTYMDVVADQAVSVSCRRGFHILLLAWQAFPSSYRAADALEYNDMVGGRFQGDSDSNQQQQHFGVEGMTDGPHPRMCWIQQWHGGIF